VLIIEKTGCEIKPISGIDAGRDYAGLDKRSIPGSSPPTLALSVSSATPPAGFDR